MNHAHPTFWGCLLRTWHGSWAATASIFGSSTGAEGAAVKHPVVAPELPLHVQIKWRTLEEHEAIVQSCTATDPAVNLAQFKHIHIKKERKNNGFVPLHVGLWHKPTQSKVLAPQVCTRHCKSHRCCPSLSIPLCWIKRKKKVQLLTYRFLKNLYQFSK